MVTTWYQASAGDFIVRIQKAWDSGLTVAHTLGGIYIEMSGDRAIAQTRMQIIQRAPSLLAAK
jgi:hypothetical protein